MAHLMWQIGEMNRAYPGSVGVVQSPFLSLSIVPASCADEAHIAQRWLDSRDERNRLATSLDADDNTLTVGDIENGPIGIDDTVLEVQ